MQHNTQVLSQNKVRMKQNARLLTRNQPTNQYYIQHNPKESIHSHSGPYINGTHPLLFI